MLVISSAADLKRLNGFRRRFEAIRFAVPIRNSDANRRLDEEFQHYYFECGCSAGGYAMGSAAILGGGWILRNWYYHAEFRFDVLPWWLTFAIGSAFVAKWAVILRARLKLAHKRRQLIEMLIHEGY